MADDWTEKYRPRSLSDVLGNPTAVRTMQEWARSWVDGIPKVRALILIGPPGIGKTSAAEALANDMGWDILEMNASDQRTGSAIENVALRASYFNTFGEDGSFGSVKDGGRKLIVLDEADSLYGNADRGAMPAIMQLVRTTKQPVILICNDFYGLTRKSSSIKNETVQINFKRPQAGTIEKALMKICAKERAHVDPEAISLIAENANGDMRAAVRDLQSLVIGSETVTPEMADRLSQRESRSDMFQFITALLRKRNIPLAKELLRECDVDPPTAEVWIDENLPSSCSSNQDLADAYDALSRADVYLGRVSKRMNYGLWSYANDMMVDGVATALKTPLNGFSRINFPSYLSKMSRTKSARATRKAVADKLCKVTHTSANRVLNESIEFFKNMCKNDGEFRIMLMREAELEPDELAYLMDCKVDDKRVKAAEMSVHPPEPKEKKAPAKTRKTSKKTETQISEKIPDPEPPAPETKPVDRKQRSLFDF